MTGAKTFSLPGSRGSTPRPRATDDFKTRDQLSLALKLSFPLPRSGAFKDLLAAIDDADCVGPVGPHQPLE